MTDNYLHEVYLIIDNFLKHLQKNDGGTVFDISENWNQGKSQVAYDIMCEENLISFRNGYKNVKSMMDITAKGVSILQRGGYSAYVSDLEITRQHQEKRMQAEYENNLLNIELNKQVLKEYPTTKKLARFGAVIGVAVLLFEVGKFIWELVSPKR